MREFFGVLAAVAAVFLSVPIAEAESKRWQCDGSSDCRRGEYSSSCAARDVVAESAERAVQINVENCEAKLNNGGGSCADGGWCCTAGTVTCK